MFIVRFCVYLIIYLLNCLLVFLFFLLFVELVHRDGCADLNMMASSMLSNPMRSSPRFRICRMVLDGIEGVLLTAIQC